MEYIVSARKYRPLTFDTVVGQTTLTKTLKNAIQSGRLAHAYLFCGPRGVGKTTCARIFARTVNCLNPTPEGEACGECESCMAFNEQRSFNIFELDAASNNGVDDIRQLTEQTRIPPQIGRYKVFIIDEVHMLSTAAFNAFLKTLEEPPAHVLFILATTEKHKLLPTIISRCQIYDFERITVQNIVDHLHTVAEKEGYTCEEEALNVIAEKADGAMRDALSIFDQVASYCQGNITYDKTIEDLNVLDTENYFRFVDLALDNNATEIMLLLNDVINKGFDLSNVYQGLANHIRNVMMAKEPQTTQLFEASAKQKAHFVEQAKRCPTHFLYRALRLLNNCDVNYKQSSNKRLLVELTFIQIAQLTQVENEAPPSGRRPTQLKPLFNNKAQQETSNNVAPQVATTNLHVAQAPKKETKSVTPTTSLYGVTFANLNATLNTPATPTDDESNNDPADPTKTADFSQETLETEWLSMCNRMQLQPDTRGLALRMKHLRPVIKDFPQVEITVENTNLLDNVKQVQRRLQSTLRRTLNNHSLTITLRLAEIEELKPMLTRAEVVAEMRKNNPAIELLFNNFDLELS